MRDSIGGETLARLEIAPGALLHAGETAKISANVAGELVLRAGLRDGFAELARARLAAGEAWTWTSAECGQFLVEFTADGGDERLRHPLAVVARDWAVCQVTVGAFTSEDFADLVHEAGVAADYYVTFPRSIQTPGFSSMDPRWRDYERRHGDAIHPHVMAKDVGKIAPELAHDDPNWETLPLAGIEARLRALQAWWRAQGYAPLDRVATYTPSNLFVQACQATGIRVVHSLCPEQNWSDGEWAINHWGMPTGPFWIAADDFRKAGARDERGVLGITMNHYQVLLPHLTHWGDFVLSPSHFTRWIRAADAGEESARFRQFLNDTVRGGCSLTEAPFFFVAGFEFGRTFGTADMTPYNRAGLARLLALAKTERLVFATSTDVRAYHDRHVPTLAGRVFRQRDNWVGVTVNGKPAQAGDSVVVEQAAYKALIREGRSLPYFYYDYRVRWDFATADTQAPADFASDIAAELHVEVVSPERAIVSAPRPLARAVPLAFWDAEVLDAGALARLPVAGLDDGRRVSVLEMPAGWSGRCELPLAPAPAARRTRRDGRWVMQTFGEGETRHTYVHLDAALLKEVRLPLRLASPAKIDDAQGGVNELSAGVHELSFGPLRGWHRVWGLGVEELHSVDDVEVLLERSGAMLPRDAERVAAERADALAEAGWRHKALRGKSKVLSVQCGAALPFGTRSRAVAWDRAQAHQPGASAAEHADGVISFGPGRSFWYHPRGLHFRIDGLAKGAQPRADERWTVLLHSFDPLKLDAAYRVSVGPAKRDAGRWRLPDVAEDAAAYYSLEVTAEDFDSRGRLAFELRSDQTALLRWWDERGFIAALHALWVGRCDAKI